MQSQSNSRQGAHESTQALDEAQTIQLMNQSLLSIDELNELFFKKWAYVFVASLILYFILGQVVYKWWAGFSYLDTLYFTVCTFSTVGK
jgi:hypothetical protein